MDSVFLLLGSNLGNRLMLIEKAIASIEEEIAPVVTASSVYETQSWGADDSPDYLNQVIIIDSDLPPRIILEKLLKIEEMMGRRREKKWGPRLIDIDILFYGQSIVNEAGLQIPHPQLQNRRFTLEPLSEIAPFFIHPVLKKNILTLKGELIDNLHVERYNTRINYIIMTDILPDQDINLAFLEEIADGSNEFMIESIDMFLFHTPESLRIINTAIKYRDWPAATTAAHKLKPNLGFFGMNICQAMMQEVELMAKTGDPDIDLIMLKIEDASDIIAHNLETLKRIKAEKMALLNRR